jgi:vacuolar protein sorting-associated protein 13A/C
MAIVSSEDTKYPKILSIEEGRDTLMKAEVCLYKDGSKGERYADLSNVDLDVMMKGAALKIVFLNGFVQKMLAFGEKFKPSDQAIAQAKKNVADMAEAARTSMKENSGARVRLDIELDGPLIIVPRNAQSDEHLEANLGTLVISNQFKYAKHLLDNKQAFLESTIDNPDYLAVIDCMTVELQMLKVTRFSGLKSPYHVLVKPMNFEVLLNRCLSDSFRGLPLIDVTGNLPAIKMEVGKPDIDFTMAFLNENMKEGATKTQSSDEPDVLPPKSEVQSPSSSASDSRRKQSGDVDIDWTRIRATFKMPEVSLSLLEQSSESEQNVRVQFAITSLTASVGIKGPCTQVSASIEDAIISDCAVKMADGNPLKILFSEPGVNLLDLNLRKVDPVSPLFKTEFEAIETKIKATIAAVDVVIHRQSVVGLMEFALSLKPTNVPSDPSIVPAKSPDMPKFEETVPTKPKTMLDTIQMELEAGLTKICVTLKSKEANLASVKIVTASAHVCQNSSGLLDTKLTVDALCIDDLRGKKNGITNFIGKYSNSDKPMLDVAYQKTLADEHIIVGFLNDLSIAVCIDFLLSLTNFGQSLLPKQAEDASKKKKKTKETEGKFLEELRKPTLENKPEQTAKPPLLANARFDMSMLHIFFLEDSFDVNTRAFYLTTEMKASFTQTQEKQEVRASLPAISLHSCIYSEKMKPRAEIVSPFDMELKYDVKLDDNTKTASVTMSSVDVSVDPYTVDMMKHVAASATSALERLRQEEGEEEEVTLTSDLFDLKPINSDDWYYDTAGTIVPVSPPPGKAGKGRTSSMLDKHRSIHQSIRDRQGSRIAIPVVEELIFEVEKFQLKLENEVKGFFYPLLSVDGVLNGKAVNWSGELTAKLNVEVEIAYYNERLAVWEPLLEPVPKFEDEFTYRQWKLHVDIKKSSPPKGDDEALAAQFDISSSVTTQQNEDANETDGSTVDTSNQGTGVEGRRMSVVEIDMPKAVFAVNVVSEDILQLTISKTALQVFTALAEDWSYAESAKGQLAKRRQFSPYDIHNKTGLKVKVWPGHAFKDPTNGSGYSIAADETWPLNFVHDTRGNTDIISKSFNADQIGQHRGGDCSVSVEVEGFKPIKNVPVLKAAVLHYNLHLLDPTMTVSLQGICLVCEVEALEGQKVIRLRSPLQVKNLLPVAMEVQTVEVVGADQQHAVSTELQPETTYYPPIIQSTNCVFMLRPQSGNYNFSHPFSWKDNKKNLFCTGGDGDGFCVRMVVKKDNYDNAVPRDKPHHTLHLSPPVILHNLLPVSLSYTVEETAVLGRIEGGNKISMFKFDLNKKPFIGIMASDCGGHEWMGQYRMDPDAAKLSFFPVKAKTSTSKDATLQLGVRTVDDLSVQMYIFCQYWMVNKTMLPLQYKPKGVNHIIEHEPSCSGAVMLAFDKGSDSKKKAQIRIMDSQWSKPFSLDIAGSGGVVRCKGKEQEYEFGVKVNLTSFQLSRIVSFTPYQVISNNTLDRLFCFEGPSQVPLIVDPGQCCPLWPEGKDGEMQVSVGANDAPKSKKFIFTRAHHTLLELSGKVVALNVEVQVSESSIVIAFSPYFNGAAPVRIENNCSNFNVIPRFWQKWSRIREEADTSFMVDPGKSKIYTWINPLGTRVLAWTFDGIKGCPEYENNLSQDNHGKIELSIQSGPKKELVKVYWASFLDGLQRVLLFTNDKDVVEKATETEHVERPDLEFTFSLHGVGIALVNNLRGITAAYIGITHSGYLWESKLVKKKRFKPESYAMCRKLEMLYNDRSKAKELKLEVDFNQMRMLAPVVKNLRRTVHEGIYFQFTMSRHHFHIHGVINRIQIDNQVMENVFPTVFYPVKPPKSVAAQAAPKPFLEGSVVIHRVEQSSVRQIKYLMVLVQEISVEVDMGFIENILQVFAPDKWDDKRELDGYKKDEERVKKSLSQSSAVEAAAKGQNLFIDFLHLSPMKIHVSFSMNALGTGEDGSSVGSPVEFLTTLLKSIGVVMADVQDVELKLSYFEVCSRTMNDKQLRRSIERHYTTQALKQVYALILGLDVIGSPFGLVNNFKDGVFDLFYEPYQGAVQGPEEFAIGVAFGVRSLVSHTVGGVFGAVSKITGTLNKGIAKLTFDDEYKRDLATSKQPKNVGEGLVKGAKGLFGGIVHGVTGVVTKPFEGAKKGGVEGFFKGVGKGVIGLVARPVGGVFELASNTFQGISNTADLDAEVVRLRCPRFIGPSKVVHPYNVHNATGNFFLQAIDSGKFSRTDVYFAHSGILDKPKIVIIVTNKRVILMEEGDLEFIDKGELKSPWSTELCEIKDVVEYKPVKDPGLAIQFVLKSYKKTKGLPLFKSKSTPELEKKAFKAPNKSSREYVIRKVNEAINKFCQPSQK